MTVAVIVAVIVTVIVVAVVIPIAMGWHQQHGSGLAVNGA
jgi:hypothetical protein